MKFHFFSTYKIHIFLVLMLLILVSWYNNNKNIDLQTVPTIAEVNSYFKNQHLLITYREGEVIYGTYYFLEIHYCLSGQYGLYGRSVKQTVLGNEQRNSWQEFGNWKVIEYNGAVGIYYKSNVGKINFVPIYRSTNGNLYINQNVSIVKQGAAICR